MKNNFYSNGKLLITGEYLILEGAKGLALPTIYGQDLVVEKINTSQLVWESLDKNNEIWFRGVFQLPDLLTINTSNQPQTAHTLQNIIKEAQKLNPEFLNTQTGFKVKTKLSFNKSWGLGSSSTLINNIAKWAQINAFELLKNSFGGSGYDIACAESDSPVLYQLQNKIPKIKKINFDPSFKNQLYFVYLNQKQNSQLEIKKYQDNRKTYSAEAEEISQLTNKLVNNSTLIDFENILIEHEKIIGSVIKQKTVQEKLFSDYFGQTKSLGAWGGDFILATGNDDTSSYFKSKGFETVIPFREMILNKRY